MKNKVRRILVLLSTVASLCIATDSSRATGGQQRRPHEPQEATSTAAAATAAATSTKKRAKSWQWIPEAQHPCNIERLSLEKFFRRFGPRGLPSMFPRPIVIRASDGTNSRVELNCKDAKDRAKDDQNPDYENERFRCLTGRDALLDFFPVDMNVTLSSSNALSERRRTIPLAQYLDEMSLSGAGGGGGGETTPERYANESWYLFGETYTAEWQRLLQHYQLPPCHTCIPAEVALSFGIGNRGSGVQWHVHGPGFSQALHGRKHWLLYPPSDDGSGNKKPAAYHKDQSSRQWMEYIYPTVKPKPLECTLEEGDLIYFPDHFWHATLNLDPYTAFVSTFTTEHTQNADADLVAFVPLEKEEMEEL